jgi:hypothetical protein
VINTFESRSLTRLFAAQTGILAAATGSRAQKEAIALRDALLAS